MRKAQIDHAWKECRSVERSHLHISSLSYESRQGIKELILNSRITAFIGPNGVGKTSFLNSLTALFFRQKNTNNRISIVKLSGQYRGKPFNINGNGASNNAPRAVEYIDPTSEIHKCKQFLNDQTNLGELLDQYDDRLIKNDHLDIYKHVCQRPYSEIRIREIEGPAEPTAQDIEEAEEAIFPFFSIKENSLIYDNRSMGSGELCAFYILWKANRAHKGSVILLDEPDSHLSPNSRRALVDALALIAKEKELWIAFTTHSIELLEALEEKEIFLVHQDKENQQLISPATHKRHTLRALGLSIQKKLLIIVEDIDSKAAVWAMVNRWGRDLAKSIDVQIISGGANEVARFITLFPKDSKFFHATAILDGDKREAYKSNPSILFLPSSDDPIKSAIEEINKDCTSFSDQLGANPEEVKQSLISISHVNHHDFLSSFLETQELGGKNVHDVRQCLINTWLRSPHIAEAAMKLVSQDLTEKIDSIT